MKFDIQKAGTFINMMQTILSLCRVTSCNTARCLSINVAYYNVYHAWRLTSKLSIHCRVFGISLFSLSKLP